MSLKKIPKSNAPNQNLLSLLTSFFQKYFFNDKLKNVFTIKNKFLDLFMNILSLINESDQIMEIFNKFVNENKGLEFISSKNKAKLFEYILDIIIKKLETPNQDINATDYLSQLHILIEIVSLTKDINRKVRNLAYELIGKITSFMKGLSLFKQWIEMIAVILASESSFVKSAAINALARIFWEIRNDNKSNIINETSDIVLLMLKDNNKEVVKSVFLFIRVLVYLNKTFNEETKAFLIKIVHSVFNELNDKVKSEFKVKMRNLLKSLILKYSFTEIKKIIPKELESLLNYINKHVVKKIKFFTNEQESLYGSANDLDNSVMMDNEENLIDEEEEYIEQEFNKISRKKNDEDKFFGKIDKLHLDEDDHDGKVNKISNDNQSDKLEELFKSNVFTYIYFRLNWTISFMLILMLMVEGN